MTTNVLRAAGNHVGGRLFAVLWGGLALVDIAQPALGRFAAAALVVGVAAVCGSGQTRFASVAIGVTGWLVIDGFVQHRYGELGFEPLSWVLLGVAVAAVLLVSAGTSTRKGRS